MDSKTMAHDSSAKDVSSRGEIVTAVLLGAAAIMAGLLAIGGAGFGAWRLVNQNEPVAPTVTPVSTMLASCPKENLRILAYQLKGRYALEPIASALRSAGYFIDFFDRQELPQLTSDVLRSYNILWVNNGANNPGPNHLLTLMEIDAIRNFYVSGGNLVLQANDDNVCPVAPPACGGIGFDYQGNDAVDDIAIHLGVSFSGYLRYSGDLACVPVISTDAITQNVRTIGRATTAYIAYVGTVDWGATLPRTIATYAGGNTPALAYIPPEGGHGFVLFQPDEQNGQVACDDRALYDAAFATIPPAHCRESGELHPQDNDEKNMLVCQNQDPQLKVELSTILNAQSSFQLGNDQSVPSGTFFPLKSNGSTNLDPTMPVTDHWLGVRRHVGLVEFFARNQGVNDFSKLRGTVTISGGTFTSANPNPITITGPQTGFEAADGDFVQITSPTTAEFFTFWSQPGDGFTLSYNDAGNSCPTPTPDKPECSDGKDNDADQKVDSADPGCHSDGNANNPATYNPLDTDETDSAPNTFPSFDTGRVREID